MGPSPSFSNSQLLVMLLSPMFPLTLLPILFGIQSKTYHVMDTYRHLSSPRIHWENMPADLGRSYREITFELNVVGREAVLLPGKWNGTQQFLNIAKHCIKFI